MRKKFTILSSQSTGCRTTSVRNRFKALFLASINSLLPVRKTKSTGYSNSEDFKTRVVTSLMS